jgi:tRNA(Ile)-lysidine synthetase-like protein
MQMKEVIQLETGKYIIAVSGGIDSVVALNVLAKNKALNLVVAHYNHGIRQDSGKDQQFTKQLAASYGLEFVAAEGNLGNLASEETARNARYDFLVGAASAYAAKGVITAHHQDDVIETCFINIIRGTGRKGLSSLKDRPGVYRPFLKINKAQITAYALANGLSWNEDSTNSDTKYLRNKIRLQVIPKMTQAQVSQITQIISNSEEINAKIDEQVGHLLRKGLHKNQPVLGRRFFTALDHSLSKEVIYAILSRMQCVEVDKKTVERLVVFCKVSKVGKSIHFNGGTAFATKRSIRFI